MKQLKTIQSAHMGTDYAPYQKIGHGYLINGEEKKVYCTIFSMPNSHYYKVCIFKPVNIGYNWNALKWAEEHCDLSVRFTENCFVIEARVGTLLPINDIVTMLTKIIDFKF